MPGRDRYDGLEIATVQVSDGAGGQREVRYLRRRPAPARTETLIARHRVTEGDRLDLISARYLGDSLAWWRICDANTALNPDSLVAPDAEGSLLAIPAPGG